MTRGLSASNVTAVEASVVRPVVFVKLELDGGTVRVHSGGRSSYDSADVDGDSGSSYTNVADFGKVSVVRETAELVPIEVMLELSGVDSTRLNEAMTETYQGRTCTIYAALLDANLDLEDTPFIWFQGYADNASYAEENGKATIYIRLVSVFEDFERARIERYSPEDLREDYSGDDLFDFMDSAALTSLQWGPVPIGGGLAPASRDTDLFDSGGRPAN